MRISLQLGTFVAMILIAAGHTPAQDPVLLAEEASGILALDNENRFSFTGSDVTLSVRVGREGEFRFAARARTNRREERPVALWLDGRTLRLARLEAEVAQPEPLVIEVAVSPGVDIAVELTDAVFTAHSVQADISLGGSDVDATFVAPAGSITVELENSTVNAKNVGGDVDLSGSGLEGKLEKIVGFSTVALTNSSVNFTELGGGGEFDLQNSVVALVDCAGELRLDATGGSVELRGAANGADVRLDEAVLSLTQTEGDVVVDTNHEVRFTDIGGNLKITGFGGKILGNGIAGSLTVSGNSAEVVVENLSGVSQIDGSDLAISAKTVRGDLALIVNSSTVVVEDAAAALTIQSEFGAVDVLRAAGDVKITARDGEVMVGGHRGNLEIRSNGPLVDVRWQLLPREKDTVIENSGGDVNLFFPRTAQCRVEAESSFGQVESSVDTVRVIDDGKRASGVIGRSNKPLVNVKAANNITITAGNPPEGGPRGGRSAADGQ